MRNTDLGWVWGGRGGLERTSGRLETEEGWARERGRFRNHPQSSLWEAPNVGRWGSWGGSYRESEGQCQDWATARTPAPSMEPELFMAQRRQLELFLSKLLQATSLLFISSSPCPLCFLSESPFRGQAITPHQCDLYAAVTCRLSPAPSVLISAFFCSSLLTFPPLLLPYFSTSLRTGAPPLELTLHCVTHHLNIFITWPLVKTVIDGISIYFHSLLHLGNDDGFK